MKERIGTKKRHVQTTTHLGERVMSRSEDDMPNVRMCVVDHPAHSLPLSGHAFLLSSLFGGLRFRYSSAFFLFMEKHVSLL